MKSKLLATTFFVCLSLCSIAQKQEVLKKTKVSFIANNLTAAQVFKTIEAKTSFHFCYSPSDISGKLLLNLKYDQQSLQKVLKELALTCNLKFFIAGNTINVAVNDPPTDRVILIRQ